MSVADQIRLNATRHNNLVSSVTSLEYAAPALKENLAKIVTLKEALTKKQSQLRLLHQKTAKERYEAFEKENSTFSKFGHKITGRADKFAAKAQKEMEEYRVAQENEDTAIAERASLIQDIEVEEGKTASLRDAVREYTMVSEQLDHLYETVLRHAGAEFPEYDEKLFINDQVQRRSVQAQKELEEAQQCFDAINLSEQFFKQAFISMGQASTASGADLMGSSLANLTKRQALSKAAELFRQADLTMQPAIRIRPDLYQPIGPFNVPGGNMMGDVYFDNIFSDMSMDKKISQSIVTNRNQHNKLASMMETSQKQFEEAKMRTDQSQRESVKFKTEIDAVRRDIFARVLAGGGGGGNSIDHQQQQQYPHNTYQYQSQQSYMPPPTLPQEPYQRQPMPYNSAPPAYDQNVRQDVHV